MREVRFTEEQMVAIMREADREPVAVVAKRTGSANRRQHERERGCYSACHRRADEGERSRWRAVKGKAR